MDPSQTIQHEQNENPYVAVVSRKVRNLKKKYDRVLQLDTQLKEGKKALNEEQLILVASKASIEKALAELESIKKQLEDVAEQENCKSPPTTSAPCVQEAASPTQMTDSSTFTQPIELVANSTQYDQEPEPVVAKITNDSTKDAEVLRAHLHKLLKLFHVCSRYTTLSGNALPADINYFGKCLLGETSIDGFSKTLNQSVKNAELYLDEVLSSQYEAIRGMSYSQISDIIDSLSNQLPTPASPHPPRVPSPSPQSPQINFFADGGLAEGGNPPHLQENYNPPLGAFSTSASPFPLPPSAVVMYDQWNTSESSPPLSPSTLAASALGGVIGSAVAATSEPQTETCIAVESSEPTNAQEQTSSSKKGRTHSRERKGGHWRGKAKENTKQTEGEARSEVSKAPSEQQNASENKKGISWGGQEKKAGGALAAVGGASEAPIPEKEGRGGGRGSGSGRTRSRGSNGRGGRGPGQDAAPAATSSSLGETNQTQGESGRRAGRGSRGRGRGSAPSRGGRSGGRTQPTPQATT